MEIPNTTDTSTRDLNQSCSGAACTFDMHEYLRNLVALFRKCTGSSTTTATSPSQSGGAFESSSFAVPGFEHQAQQPSRSSAAVSKSRNAQVPFSGANSPHQRRSYSTSATLFSSASSSSSSQPPSTGITNQNTTQPLIDFDRLSHLIPNQGVVGADSVWYVVTTASLLAFHKEAAVGELWKYISQRCERDSEMDVVSRQLAIARRIRESCLKASVLVGFPRAINALLSLHSSISENNNVPDPTDPSKPTLFALFTSDKPLRTLDTFPSADARYARGEEFFSQIYADYTKRILSSMRSTSAGDLDYFAVTSVYGELMSEMRILDGRETVLLEFVCCLADEVGAQAKGHFFGCSNLKVSGEEMRGSIAMVREIAGQLGNVNFLRNVEGDGFRFLGKAEGW
ncbi:hypothetical protein AJ79_07282 [Helicocarpus griseus UAMH5409]|uniref:Uncharacterized protein n=1 Tax=Helicocarpus griseus UAMH5409 TaxID=1447875 RepID=A0A2B7X4B2_9EURO|nr:hypothetical protein AJ79_07282 [Helicocarpus griseus UAMH5409]